MQDRAQASLRVTIQLEVKAIQNPSESSIGVTWTGDTATAVEPLRRQLAWILA